MDFDRTYVATLAASKQLEARWFFDEDDEEEGAVKKNVHGMPFMCRNLSYWRGMQYRGQRKRKRLSATKSSARSSSDKTPIDILYTQWKHRARNFNVGYLLSNRRGIKRKHSKQESGEDDVILIADKPTRAKDDVLCHDENGANSNGVNSNGEIKKDCNNNTPKPELVAFLVSEPEESTDNGAADVVNGRRDDARQENVDRLADDTMYDYSIDIFRDVVTWDKPGEGAQLHPKAKAVFHLLYVEPKSQEICLQSEVVGEDRRCPFCYFDGGSDTGLVMHCVISHARLKFKAARSEDGTLHVGVMKQPRSPVAHKHDFCFVRRPADGSLIPSVPFVKRQLSRAGALDLPTRRKKIKLLMEVGAGESSMKQFERTSEVPVRQYFHSRSNEPMLEGEWDVDSDDEDDENWQTKMGEELLDEFEDVTPAEKKFTKLWNKFMKSHSVIADRDIPAKCAEFVREYGSEVKDLKLRQELLLHFSGFWDNGIISSTHLMTLMADFDKLVRGECSS